MVDNSLLSFLQGGITCPLLSPPGLLKAADRLEAGCGKCRQGFQGPQSQFGSGPDGLLPPGLVCPEGLSGW